MENEESPIIEEKKDLTKGQKIFIILAFTGLTLILIGLTKKKEIIIPPKKPIKKAPRPIVVNINNGEPKKVKKEIEENEENEENNENDDDNNEEK